MNVIRCRLNTLTPRIGMWLPAVQLENEGAVLMVGEYNRCLIVILPSRAIVCITWSVEIPIQETFWGDL